jgi:hypothetical protein
MSAAPSGFLLSRMAMRPGRWATSMQLLPPPDDLVLLRQVAAERAAGAVGSWCWSPDLLLEEGAGLPGVRAAVWSLSYLGLVTHRVPLMERQCSNRR